MEKSRRKGQKNINESAEEIKNIHRLSLSILWDQLEKDRWLGNRVEMEI